MIEQDLLYESDLYSPFDGLEKPRERLGFLDFILGFYIVLVMVFEYTDYRFILSSAGMLIPVLFLCGSVLNWFSFQREFISLAILAVWLILGSLASAYREMAFLNTIYYLKVQFLMMFVALQCSNFKRMKFYIGTIALGTASMVIPSLLFKVNLQYTEREVGNVGEPNALGAIAAISFIAWACLFLMTKIRLRWILCPVMAAASFLVILRSASRGAAVTVVFFLFFGSLFVFRRSRILWKVLYAILFCAGCVVALYVAKGSAIMSRVGQDTGRLDIAMAALGVFAKYPILGPGFGTSLPYIGAVNTHTTPLDFLSTSGIVGFSLYYFVLVSGWFVMTKSKKLYAYDSEVWRNISLCQLLLLAQIGAGISLPAHTQKAQAVFSGIWLGIVWYLRTINAQHAASEQEYESHLPGDTENPEAA